MVVLHGSAAGEHPELRHQRLSSTAIEPFLGGPAGRGLIAVMTPKKTLEHEPIALIHHLRPEPHALRG
jgi:hypothetical protein